MKITRHIRRNKIELYYIILKLCNDTQKRNTRSEINQKLSISFKQLNEYLINLKELGLIEINNYDRSFHTSSKGEEFMKKFYHLIQQTGDLDRINSHKLKTTKLSYL